MAFNYYSVSDSSSTGPYLGLDAPNGTVCKFIYSPPIEYHEELDELLAQMERVQGLNPEKWRDLISKPWDWPRLKFIQKIVFQSNREEQDCRKGKKIKLRVPAPRRHCPARSWMTGTPRK